MRSSVDVDLVSQLHNHRNQEISEIAHKSVLRYGHNSCPSIEYIQRREKCGIAMF